MPIRRFAILVAFAGILVSGVAADAASPCDADLQKVCADKPAAGGARHACLKSKEAELSEPCKKHVDAVKKRQGPMVAACSYDIAVLCSDVEPGSGRVAACLGGKQDELTPECKERVGKSAKP